MRAPKGRRNAARSAGRQWTTGHKGGKSGGAHVAILMAVYQGRDHLPAQLASLAAQSHRGWSLIAGDDGSTDGSAALLADFAAAQEPGRVRVVTGPGRGQQRISGRCCIMSPAQASHVAFCDQDDVWTAEKLATAIAALPADRPAIWCSRVVNCDEDLQQLSLSPMPRHPPRSGMR